jgi:hypothetical protein
MSCLVDMLQFLLQQPVVEITLLDELPPNKSANRATLSRDGSKL